MDGQSGEAKVPMIYGALAKMIAAVGIVGKTRKNAAQGYQFRGIDDVLSACQAVLSEHGVVCVPRVVEREREMIATKSGGTMASVRLLVDHTFFARDGSFVVCTTLGEAMDAGDKASNKAMSAALKYALTETLCIPTHEDDRDTEEASPEVAPPKAQAKPAAAAKAPTPSADAMAKEEGLLLGLFETTTPVAELKKLWPRVSAFAKGTPAREKLETNFVRRGRELEAQEKAAKPAEDVPF